MASNALNLETLEQWEQLRKDAAGRPCVIFKYSPICGLSRGADREFKVWLKSRGDQSDALAAQVNVIDARPVSRRIAEDTGVQHQSPQVIVLGGDGAVRWHASHFDIRADQLAAQVKQ